MLNGWCPPVSGHMDGERYRVLYDAYELHKSLLNSASNWAAIGAQLLNNPALPMGYFGTGPIIASAPGTTGSAGSRVWAQRM